MLPGAAERTIWFQSSLELSPECNGAGDVSGGSADISILTRAFARVQRARLRALPWPWRISILTRAFARVQRRGSTESVGNLKNFNPHSSFRPSATPVYVVHVFNAKVSILTRAFARVQRSLAWLHSHAYYRFNPHSSFRPSATYTKKISSWPTLSFNPHSSFRPSATSRLGTQ